ncbi:hypothetical protein AX15_003032 [Amanita polypyramis BW_CC]|nr:hypothetical protein AX15_003032 [Amanita polypyramis BW_CC]
MKMFTKAIPEPLHLSPRHGRLRKPRRKPCVTDCEIYSAASGNKSEESLEEIGDFVDIGSSSLWEVSTASSPTVTETPEYNESGLTSPPKSSRRIKRWLTFCRRSKTTDVVMPNSAPKTPSTAPAYLESDLASHRSFSVPNLRIEPPQLTFDQLAKIDAFYAPTPVLPENPAPRLGEVQTPWSPDIDNKFNPRPVRSSSLRAIRTADVERGYSREEGLKRLKTLGSVPATSISEEGVSHSCPSVFLQAPVSSPSEITFHSQRRPPVSTSFSVREKDENAENWRQIWVYGRGEDEMCSNFDSDSTEVEVQDTDAQTADDLKTPTDLLSPFNGLYFTVGESDDGEVTLRFIEDPIGLSVPISEVDARPRTPLTPMV